MRYRKINNWGQFDDGKEVQSSDPGFLEDQRSRVRAELVSSEEIYAKKLQTFYKHYAYPLSQEKHDHAVMKHQDKWDRYFKELENIKDFHRDVMVTNLQAAQPSQEDGDYEDIGERFMNVASYLTEMYVPYLRKFSEIRDSIKNERRKSKYQQFFDDASRQCGGLQIEDFLIMPVQRIPRYKMLLSELIKYTPDDHEEKKSLQEAHEMILKILADVNSRAN
uniref:DH domain-containing protein n=2 Tax=Lotharella globosa TaxID=91324 RepID=A0A7S3YHZ2_9EUKA|mmetsp:Transcript_22344/g.44858  ORF Transcript_22344/g.44858 Transcript_22344/m.44858 type:complete len:221 (+) Transcript_22344:511-1173(+)